MVVVVVVVLVDFEIDRYPDFPEPINAAKAQNWGSPDLFPTFGMGRLT
jgi:hypothetical protein